ncbi:uncharacterized protein M437DRAFT_62785 [Aureobasidium melanogenum CBS 110374]|uniref:Uncharacterized protein n=1 Tax=Aureobasidium melanogenum (strain CBS 110374) TaxID=1043003 RepID=A0A074W1D5_AURM1|nr:uncharacterized protein M437DRAFT_62785 [Aureobasidium melanogenum CBS 110374]KEQ66593.1 hypothetical protein M437DRAFT_62785 [Aureobasidium melanogenum CBS 110374]
MTSMIHYINVFTSCKRIKISKRAWLIYDAEVLCKSLYVQQERNVLDNISFITDQSRPHVRILPLHVVQVEPGSALLRVDLRRHASQETEKAYKYMFETRKNN